MIIKSVDAHFTNLEEDVNDLDEICLSYITRVMSMDPILNCTRVTQT